jgi:hypothetical protein
MHPLHLALRCLATISWPLSAFSCEIMTEQFASHYRSQQRGLDLVLRERNTGTEFPI